MTDNSIKIKEFIENWKGRGNEKQDTQSYWNELLAALGADEPTRRIKYEKPVDVEIEKDGERRESQKYIDAYIPETRVLIEQKDISKSLSRPARQSDGAMLTPYEQGLRYAKHMKPDEVPYWIVTSNFQEIRVYNNRNRGEAPHVIELKDLERDYTRLSFLLSSENVHLEKEKELSLAASSLIGKIYDSLLNEYLDKDDPKVLESLNILAVRLTFLLYAEDAGLLGERLKFFNYMSRYKDDPGTFRTKLQELFDILDTPESQRDPYLDQELLDFPYINGALFRRDPTLILPRFSSEAIKLILQDASAGFDWASISPTIFGAAFESTLDSKTRHDGGLHYTSISNIHRVTDFLFLDDLTRELEDILKMDNAGGARTKKLNEYHDKLGSLTFLDPACGSGNFLTETYLSLKRLENRVIEAKLKGQIGWLGAKEDLIKVRLENFHGIELNDWAVSVAKTALWIAEHQALLETQRVLNANLDFLPLSSYTGIVEGNALKLNWSDIVKPWELNYIIGNPPFLGYSQQNKEQKADLKSVWVNEKGKAYPRTGKIDYVSGWFFKAAEFIYNTPIKVAFVSTNSITQGDQVAPIWKPLIERFNIHIDFAYKTFVWSNDSRDGAHVHVVIIGFSEESNKNPKRIIDGSDIFEVESINPYLFPTENILIESRNKPLWDIPEAKTGNRAADGKALTIKADEYEDFIKKEPGAKKFIKKYLGSEELINNKERYCLWLVDATPKDIRSMKLVKERVELSRSERMKGAKDRQKLADTPHLFRETLNPDKALVIPCTSSQNRRYIPMDFIDKDTIASAAVLIVPDADLYHFSILNSNVHNAWVRSFAGRLKSDYRYSKDIVYNNFPWPNLNDETKAKLNRTAQKILDARANHPDSTLADLYDPLTMPPDLLKAHRENDAAVMQAYGWNWRGMSEEDAVVQLMKLYSEKIK